MKTLISRLLIVAFTCNILLPNPAVFAQAVPERRQDTALAPWHQMIFTPNAGQLQGTADFFDTQTEPYNAREDQRLIKRGLVKTDAQINQFLANGDKTSIVDFLTKNELPKDGIQWGMQSYIPGMFFTHQPKESANAAIGSLNKFYANGQIDPSDMVALLDAPSPQIASWAAAALRTQFSIFDDSNLELSFLYLALAPDVQKIILKRLNALKQNPLSERDGFPGFSLFKKVAGKQVESPESVELRGNLEILLAQISLIYQNILQSKGFNAFREYENIISAGQAALGEDTGKSLLSDELSLAFYAKHKEELLKNLDYWRTLKEVVDQTPSNTRLLEANYITSAMLMYEGVGGFIKTITFLDGQNTNLNGTKKQHDLNPPNFSVLATAFDTFASQYLPLVGSREKAISAKQKNEILKALVHYAKDGSAAAQVLALSLLSAMYEAAAPKWTYGQGNDKGAKGGPFMNKQQAYYIADKIKDFYCRLDAATDRPVMNLDADKNLEMRTQLAKAYNRIRRDAQGTIVDAKSPKEKPSVIHNGKRYYMTWVMTKAQPVRIQTKVKKSSGRARQGLALPFSSVPNTKEVPVSTRVATPRETVPSREKNSGNDYDNLPVYSETARYLLPQGNVSRSRSGLGDTSPSSGTYTGAWHWASKDGNVWRKMNAQEIKMAQDYERWGNCYVRAGKEPQKLGLVANKHTDEVMWFLLSWVSIGVTFNLIGKGVSAAGTALRIAKEANKLLVAQRLACFRSFTQQAHKARQLSKELADIGVKVERHAQKLDGSMFVTNALKDLAPKGITRGYKITQRLPGGKVVTHKIAGEVAARQPINPGNLPVAANAKETLTTVTDLVERYVTKVPPWMSKAAYKEAIATENLFKAGLEGLTKGSSKAPVFMDFSRSPYPPTNYLGIPYNMGPVRLDVLDAMNKPGAVLASALYEPAKFTLKYAFHIGTFLGSMVALDLMLNPVQDMLDGKYQDAPAGSAWYYKPINYGKNMIAPLFNQQKMDEINGSSLFLPFRLAEKGIQTSWNALIKSAPPTKEEVEKQLEQNPYLQKYKKEEEALRAEFDKDMDQLIALWQESQRNPDDDFAANDYFALLEYLDNKYAQKSKYNLDTKWDIVKQTLELGENPYEALKETKKEKPEEVEKEVEYETDEDEALPEYDWLPMNE